MVGWTTCRLEARVNSRECGLSSCGVCASTPHTAQTLPSGLPAGFDPVAQSRTHVPEPTSRQADKHTPTRKRTPKTRPASWHTQHTYTHTHTDKCRHTSSTPSMGKWWHRRLDCGDAKEGHRVLVFLATLQPLLRTLWPVSTRHNPHAPRLTDSRQQVCWSILASSPLLSVCLDPQPIHPPTTTQVVW
ncbi:unnamed protein product [Protopolystoma xenopodis]|uniref:Uncharacterized protein n=1 Tax=Protopolystoma xenopodis TaxID=117903 RepID=A0A448WQT9_9PLAT|nr:unnamed protein product [Protopolystoma xenopodis]